MSTQYVKVFVPPIVEAPRGARWAALAAVWLARAFSSRPARNGSGDVSSMKETA